MTEPATRAEMLDVIRSLVSQAKMPSGVKNARFVRVPAEVHAKAHAIVLAELGHFPVAVDGAEKDWPDA